MTQWKILILLKKKKQPKILELGVERGVSTKVFVWLAEQIDGEVFSIDINKIHTHSNIAASSTFINNGSDVFLTSGVFFKGFLALCTTNYLFITIFNVFFHLLSQWVVLMYGFFSAKHPYSIGQYLGTYIPWEQY